MAESVVSIVAERLSDLLIQEGKFLHGVSDQIELIQLELELMQTYLEDADKRHIQDKRVETWISKIRETAYDVEDVVETFLLKIQSRRRGGIKNAFKRYACIIHEAAELHKVGSEIEAIKTRITTLTRCLNTYGIKHIREGEEGSNSVIERRQRWRQSYAHEVEDYTVGLDADKKKLVEQLINEEKQCRVVSICGMGGLGKTTLAKKVYHCEEIRRHFDGFAWAFLSQQFQLRNVLEGILLNLVPPPEEKIEDILKYNDTELVEKLHKVQQEKKCLVILDDIWTKEAWASLRSAFPVGNESSKILLTTRNEEVAVHVDPKCFLHKLRFLTQEEGCVLLQKKAFPGESDVKMDENMKILVEKMVKRCAGLPLAIVVLGGILATKRTDEWKMVNDNIDSYLRRGKGHEAQELGVKEILALSYHELPYQLKPCFLYLGHFPEDFDIPTKKLVRMWIAEGFVSPVQYEAKGAETLEEVAEFYLGELLNRSMVQVGERGSTGRVKTCRLHDLMRDLCLSKANEENFLEILDTRDESELRRGGSLSSTVTTVKLINNRIRRIAIIDKEARENIYSLKSESTAYLRSLLVTGTCQLNRLMKKMELIKLCRFKLLKVLEIGTCAILPREIGDLVHLRYLNARAIGGRKIPSSIANLRCLQTLIIGMFSGRGMEMSNIIWKMKRLRHLCLPQEMKVQRGKLQLGNLRELQTLQYFDARIFDVRELTKLTNLKKLGIHELSCLKELKGVLISSSSVSSNRLRSLCIYSNVHEETELQILLSSSHDLCKLHLGGRIVKLPECSKFPQNLTKLSLHSSGLTEDPMPTLEKLPNLTILYLLGYAFNGREMACSANGFPQLKSLDLWWCRFFEDWCVEKNAMPSLCKLVIRGCKRLKMVPDGLRFITTLRELHIEFMLGEFEKRVKEGGEDYDKVKHVPSISFISLRQDLPESLSDPIL